MQRQRFLVSLSSAFGVSLLAIHAYASVLINEFEPNPTGTDPPISFVEFTGTPGQLFSGWLLAIESDQNAQTGSVKEAFLLGGTFGNDGLLLNEFPDIENPSYTLLLVDQFTGTVGVTDIDADNDGIADDLTGIGQVLDAIGVPDQVEDEPFLYGVELGGQDFTYTNDEPQLIFRDRVSFDWYAVNDENRTPEDVYDVAGNLVANAAFDFNPEIPTWGSPNPSVVPEPTSLLIVPTLATFIFLRQRRRNNRMNASRYDGVGA